MKCCVAVSICSYLVKSRILSASRSQRYNRRSVVYAIRYPSDFRCIRGLNLALVGCARYTLGFWFPKKYAHQNDPLNQGNLHELKLRLKIVRYPGIEVALYSLLNHHDAVRPCSVLIEAFDCVLCMPWKK